MAPLLTLVAGALLAVGVTSTQVPLGASFVDTGFDAPESDMRSLSTEGYTTLADPSFPEHSVRIKRVDDFCDKTVA